MRLGRNYTETYEIAAKYDPMSGGNFGGLMQVFDSRQTGLDAVSGNMLSSCGSARVDNSVHYRTPALSGFVGRVTYAAGEVAGSARQNSVRSVALEYTNGAFEAPGVFGQMYSPAGPVVVNALFARVDNEVFDEQPTTCTLRVDHFRSKRSMVYAG